MVDIASTYGAILFGASMAFGYILRFIQSVLALMITMFRQIKRHNWNPMRDILQDVRRRFTDDQSIGTFSLEFYTSSTHVLVW